MALHCAVRTGALGVLIFIGVTQKSIAQVTRTPAQANAACTTVIVAHRLTGTTCFELAAQIVDSIVKGLYAPAPRDVQSDVKQPALAGSPAQAEAVPGAQPVGIGGASLAEIGTDSGTKAIVAIALNPATLVGNTSQGDRIAKLSRIADLTLLLPVDGLDDDKDGKVDYVGARIRLNFNGSQAGSRIMKDAGAALLKAVQGETDQALALEPVLSAAPDVEGCYRALLDPDSDSDHVKAKCGGQFRISFDPKVYETLQAKLADARAQADAKYLGLDLRFDFGDATLGAVADTRATSIDAGLAMGRQFLGADPSGPSIGFKARAGLRYTHLTKVRKTSYAFDGAIGIEGRRPLTDGQTITASAGLEFRYGGDRATERQAQTNSTVFRAALAVPVAGTTGITLAVAAPLDGPITPVMSVQFNWNLLLPKKGALP